MESAERVFEAIRQKLRENPDLRVGQIIGSACADRDFDPFNVENDNLAERIRGK